MVFELMLPQADFCSGGLVTKCSISAAFVLRYNKIIPCGNKIDCHINIGKQYSFPQLSNIRQGFSIILKAACFLVKNLILGNVVLT